MWHRNWQAAKKRLTDWWEGKGTALCVTAPANEAWADIPAVTTPGNPTDFWTNLDYRINSQVHWLSRTYYGGAAFPYLDTQIGPGSLGLFLGNEPGFEFDTVWYKPLAAAPEDWPELVVDRSNRWFRLHMALIGAARSTADGRYLVGVPDLIENLDTLAQLRDPQTLMLDLVERPDWVEARIDEINDAFFDVFGAMYAQVEEDGGNAFAAFQIWGPGKTAKVQCDACAMISPSMFRRFVQPALSRQCDWLDYSMYHLDGTQAVVHLDALLEIEGLNAIEWTPQAGLQGGGDPRWFDLYRRILAGGKSVQAIGVTPSQVLPLLDAVGTDGIFLSVGARTEEEARALEHAVYG